MKQKNSIRKLVRFGWHCQFVKSGGFFHLPSKLILRVDCSWRVLRYLKVFCGLSFLLKWTQMSFMHQRWRNRKVRLLHTLNRLDSRQSTIASERCGFIIANTRFDRFKKEIDFRFAKRRLCATTKIKCGPGFHPWSTTHDDERPKNPRNSSTCDEWTMYHDVQLIE